jgi:hypothetical protein
MVAMAPSYHVSSSCAPWDQVVMAVVQGSVLRIVADGEHYHMG